MKINILLVLILLTGLRSYEQAGQRPIDSTKLNLIQYMLSTHSVINSALNDKDPKTKANLKNLALKYLNQASALSLDLQKNKKLEKRTIKSIAIVLQGYSDLLKEQNFNAGPAATTKLSIIFNEINAATGAMICL